MPPIARATILHYHRHRIAQFGADSVAALGWRAASSQQRRFAVIAAAADFNHSRVLDLGCGTGDLKPFLDQRFVDVAYLGLDQQPEFIDLARARHGHLAETFFEVADCFAIGLPPVDHVVACGALGYRCDDPDFVANAIRHMYAAAEKTLIFNVLDAAVFPEHPLLIGRDVAAVADFCRSLCPSVALVRGYAPDDATLVLRRAG